MKTCYKCGKEQPIAQFRFHICKTCSNKTNVLKKQYGMTLEDFFNLKEKQNSCCAICNTKLAENKDIHVDHCHTTGMVRGLLCRGCNLGLGNFFDNIQALTEAIKYLQKYAPQTP